MKSPRSAYMRNYQRHLTWRSQDHMCLAALAWVYRRKQIFVILFAGILLSGGIPGTTKLPRERHFLRRSDLMPNPRLDSSWLAIYRNYRDSAFIHTLGINTATFELLLAAGFRDGWDKYTIPRGDVNPNGQSRPGARSLDAEGALAATLYHLCSVVPDKSLEQMFAIVPSSLSRYLSRSVPLLLDVLKSMPEARISWPSRQEMKQSSEIITHRHPNINGAFGFMDGLNLPCQTSGDAGEQSAMFNGWCRAHVVSNVLVFDPKGMIVAATINAPGSWHDVRVANLDIYRLLLENTPEGFFVIADSAFKSRDEELSKKIHTPLKANSIFENLTDEQVAAEWAYSADITSARQAVEWGMRAIQGCFARLRVPLDANDKLARRHLIEVCLRLHNLRTSRVGINQIRTVYIPAWTSNKRDFFGRLHATLFPESLGREDGIEPFPGGINDTVPAVL
ncbi:DDE superfamily endonuclease [Ceratobasidium sp. AG-Ba]|nr:DDE superfamily endonuclease [Ceratobasidium sp. AG-Ba]